MKSWKFEINGLGEFQRGHRDASGALQALDGKIGTVHLKANDPESVDAAVAEVNSTVEARVVPWKDNALVKQVVSGFEERCAAAIRERARSSVTDGDLRREEDA